MTTKYYGTIGLALIIIVQINFFYRIEPLASWYFPLIWFGYILVVDALVYNFKGSSLIMNKTLEFGLMFFLSIPLWYVFELFNIFVSNWAYNPEFNAVIRFVSAAFLLPAFYETFMLFNSIKVFDNIKLKKSYKVSKKLIYLMLGFGFASIVLPMIFPDYLFPLIWTSFFFILDPINYLNKMPSIIGHLKEGKLKTPLSLIAAGLLMGFLWEAWNFWAVPKWTYSIPFFDFLKVFEMPILGYLGYMTFALEFYSMYWFAKSLFKQFNQSSLIR